MVWIPSAADEASTPQEAFAANIRLFPCGFDIDSPQTLTPTWLAAGPTFGCVLIYADCQNAQKHEWLIIVSLGLDTQSDPAHHRWTVQGGGLLRRPEPEYSPPPDLVASVPFWSPPEWLPLPSDTYLFGSIGTGLVSPSTGYVWYSTTQEFLAIRCKGALVKPMHAQETTVSGQDAWMIEKNGITTIVVTPANDWPIFFAGTAPPLAMLQFAQGGVDHIDTLLPKQEW